MLYLDTSAFVPIYVPEGRSNSILLFLGARPGASIVSEWTLTEAASALALKVRTGALTAAQRDVAAAHIARAIATAHRREAVENGDFVAAADMIVQCPSPLRSGDALHLAIAKRLGATVITFDGEMQQAAAALSITFQAV
jgi:predicted nucleic acid-binding protein